MARFNGIPVQGDAPAAPRFKGEPVAVAKTGQHLSFEEGQKLLEQEDLQGRNGELGAFLTSTVEGAPIVGPYALSGAQKAAAGISTLINGGSYGDNLDQAKEITQIAQQQNPIASAAGQITGAVASTAPLVAAAPALFGAGGGSLPVRMLAGATSGGVIGGADSAVRSDGDLLEIGKGAGLGLGLGMTGPLAGDLIGRGVKAVQSSRATTDAARQAGTSREAVDVVARAMAADNAAGATNANIQAAGGGAMLADAGPSTLSTLDTAIQRGGPRAGEAASRINARAEQATQDITAALDQGLGAPEGMVKPLTALRQQTQPARAAAYDAAYATPIDYADPRGIALEKVVKTRVPQSAINRANELMRVNGEESQQILAKIADDGSVVFEKLPDVRQLDYITRGLKDVASEADGKGKLGGQTDIGRAYEGLSREIRNLTKSLVPEYKTALDTAAAPIAERESKLFGQTMLLPSVARDEVEAFVSGLSDAELKSLRGGLRSQFAEKLSNVKRTVSDPNVDARQGVAALRDLSSDAAREKLATVMGQSEADAMLKAVDQAAKAFEIRAGVATNSKTYARQAAERAVDAATQPGIIENAASGRPWASSQGFLQGLFGTGPQAQLGRQDAAWGEIANILTQPANQGGGAFLQALQGAAGRLPVIDQNAARITDAVTRGAAMGAAPTRRLEGT
ncbi:hypothetical protein J5288_08465 [Agrobacterium sp. S2/73]|uniref:hypothetical protein n=1 Tax=unclassified Agrobacterium TaxID=2632611 RepID=UPI001ADC8A9E|nr:MULTISPECIES: hypothetical protein [unclassified Agrobacterium]MBO9108734.1 hypothetical protein [Agrobacterium sp. S2/73]QXZ73508.1 hypothetical protein J5276_06045 [Agrobacterium sp. S7/73]